MYNMYVYIYNMHVTSQIHCKSIHSYVHITNVTSQIAFQYLLSMWDGTFDGWNQFASNFLFLIFVRASKYTRVMNQWNIMATAWIKMMILKIAKNNKLKAQSGRLYWVSCGKTKVYRNSIHMIFVRSITSRVRLQRFNSFSFNSSTLNFPQTGRGT